MFFFTRSFAAARPEISSISAFAFFASALAWSTVSLASASRTSASNFAATKREVEKEIKDLQADIQRVDERFTAWDSARERQFYARLDEAEARLQVWNAQTNQKRADVAMKSHDDLAALEEKIALARARAAAAKNERYSAKARAALEESERYFDQAYDAAVERYGTT